MGVGYAGHVLGGGSARDSPKGPSSSYRPATIGSDDRRPSMVTLGGGGGAALEAGRGFAVGGLRGRGTSFTRARSRGGPPFRKTGAPRASELLHTVEGQILAPKITPKLHAN